MMQIGLVRAATEGYESLFQAKKALNIGKHYTK
jgi:hypothetical protein